MPRRSNLPGNRAAREHARIQFLINNPGIFNRIRNINMMRNPSQKQNAIVGLVMATRLSQLNSTYLPIGTFNVWRKLHEAYNIVRNIRNRERQRRAAERERRRPRQVSASNAKRLALALNNTGFSTVVLNPGNNKGNAKVKLVNIKNNIRKYIAGNKNALKKWPLNNLVRVNWNRMGGNLPFYQNNNGRWRRVNGNTLLTKELVLENINLGSARLRSQ